MGKTEDDVKNTKYFWLHVCDGRETVRTIGRRFGYNMDYGPIAAFPPNAHGGIQSANSKPGPYVILVIPWPQHFLMKAQTALMRKMAHNINNYKDMSAGIQNDKKSIDDEMFKIDMIAAIAQVAAGTGKLTFDALKKRGMFAASGGVVGAETLLAKLSQFSFEGSKIDVIRNLISSSQLSAQQIEGLLFIANRVGGNIQIFSTALIPAPKKPEKGGMFYLRHAFGAWNPSYWASIYGAVKEGNIEIYEYGSAAISHQQAVRAYNIYVKTERKIQGELRDIKKQASCGYYNVNMVSVY